MARDWVHTEDDRCTSSQALHSVCVFEVTNLYLDLGMFVLPFENRRVVVRPDKGRDTELRMRSKELF